MIFTSDEAPTLNDILTYYGYSESAVFGFYPIWNANKRDWVNKRITEHFRYRQINQDTPAQFCNFFQRKMEEVMPAFNPIFKALENAKPADATSWQDARVLASNTPQTQLSGEENYADALQDTHIESGINQAQALQQWYMGINNALTLLYTELEPLFYQFWEVN